MSNHLGSYLLNDVLCLLEEKGVFELLGRRKTQSLLNRIVGLSFDYDCNQNEILEEIAERLGFCSCCLRSAKKFEYGLCPRCREDAG